MSKWEAAAFVIAWAVMLCCGYSAWRNRRRYHSGGIVEPTERRYRVGEQPMGQLWPHGEVAESERINRCLAPEVTSDEPLQMPPPPNLGGEGRPQYKGPNYVEPVEIAEEMKGIGHYGEDN